MVAAGAGRLAQRRCRLWLVNLFAPEFGHNITEVALKELEQTAFAGRPFRMHRRGADGKMTMEVVGAAR